MKTAVMINQLQSTIDWLTNGARSAPRPDRLVSETCERMVASGMPLWRVGVFVRTLHPTMMGRNFIWKDDGSVAMGSIDYGEELDDAYQSSPLLAIFEEGKEVRQRLTGVDIGNKPFFFEMRDEGATDYIALPFVMSDGTINASSWVTRAPNGFSDEQLGDLREAIPALTRMVEIHLLRRTAAGLLDNYVGGSAGARILAGQIRRGHTETMNAAIWLSDLRGFTKLSDRLSPEAVVQILNAYFDCQVPAILEQGGEVLKFMGDGLLAVFPIADDAADADSVCAKAMAAARESRAKVASMSLDLGSEVISDFRFGLALHVGAVLYGNIGGGNRLDFTCIGPAVNLAARLEKIAGQTGRSIVASTAFARYTRDDWHDLGEFAVAGFAASERVYGLSDETQN